MKWHPDKNQSGEAKEFFTNISYAYEVLSKNDSRKDYDESTEIEVE
jgi:DnaJ-class molecular chaperone